MAKVSTKTDNFTSYDSAFWSNSFGSVSVVSGQGNVTTTSSGGGFMSGTNTWDLTSSAISLKVTQVPTGTLRYAVLQMQSDSSNLVEIGVYEGNLYAKKKVAGVDTSFTIMPYNSTKHAYWRIRETSSNLYFEFSNNSTDWSIGATTSSPAFLTTMYILMASGGGSGSTFIFDDLNIVSTTYNKYGFDGSTQTLFGLWAGYAESGGTTGIASHESLVGRTVEVASDYQYNTGSWSEFDETFIRNTQLDTWRTWRDARPGSKLAWGIPMLVGGYEGQFTQGVNGDFDVYYIEAAQALINSGHSDAIVRLGWEPNNADIGPWQATGNPSGYASLFQRIVNIFRAQAGQNFKFELSSAIGFWSGSIDSFDDYYPGDSYVDYLGLNIYDMWPGMPNLTPAERWLNMKTKHGGIDDFVAFANSHSKRIVCSEWGLYAANGSPDYDGGGDSPYFVNAISEYFHHNNVYYQAYFNTDFGGGTLSSFTNGQARYVTLFKNRRAADTTSITNSFTKTDTGSALDTGSVFIESNKSGSDTATSTESHSIAVSFTRTDTASGLDAQSVEDLSSLPYPTGLTVTPISTTQLDVSWNSVPTATGYDLERNSVVVAENISTTSYEDTGLQPDTTYVYRVRARRE